MRPWRFSSPQSLQFLHLFSSQFAVFLNPQINYLSTFTIVWSLLCVLKPFASNRIENSYNALMKWFLEKSEKKIQTAINRHFPLLSIMSYDQKIIVVDIAIILIRTF